MNELGIVLSIAFIECNGESEFWSCVRRKALDISHEISKKREDIGREIERRIRAGQSTDEFSNIVRKTVIEHCDAFLRSDEVERICKGRYVSPKRLSVCLGILYDALYEKDLLPW